VRQIRESQADGEATPELVKTVCLLVHGIMCRAQYRQFAYIDEAEIVSRLFTRKLRNPMDTVPLATWEAFSPSWGSNPIAYFSSCISGHLHDIVARRQEAIRKREEELYYDTDMIKG
jgi:hypothetical protein